MRKLFILIVAGGILASAAAMGANESPGGAASDVPLAMPSLFKTAPSAPAPAPALPQSSPADPIKATLRDGTHIEIMEDGSVLIVGDDGTKVPAPDGVHTLRDGTTFEVKNGKQTGE